MAMMKRAYILPIAAAIAFVAMLLGMGGCEKVTWDTTYSITTLKERTQTIPGEGENPPTTKIDTVENKGNIVAHLFYVSSPNSWKPVSYDEALAGRIIRWEQLEAGGDYTETDRMDTPSMTVRRDEGEQSDLIEFRSIDKGTFVIVVCDTDMKIYGYKGAATAANLPLITNRILFRPDYTASESHVNSTWKWTMVNEFIPPKPDPEEPEDPEGPEEPDPGEGGDDPEP